MNRLKIAIVGASGRMGRMLIESTLKDGEATLVAAIDRADVPVLGKDAGEMVGIPCGVPVTSDVEAGIAMADCLIDFTRPEGTLEHLDICRRHKVAIVIGTTGFDAAGKQAIADAAREIPVVFAPNTRQFRLAGTTGGGTIDNDGTNALTINSNLAITGTGNKTLTLQGATTGFFNTFGGNIPASPGSTVALTKGETGTWAITGNLSHTGLTTASGGSAATGGQLRLSGTNSNTGGYVVNGNGLLIFQGAQSLAAGNAISLVHAGGSNASSALRLLDDTPGTVTFTGTTINLDVSNTTGSQSIFVGNNNTANLGTSSSTNTNSTIAVPTLNFSSLASNTSSVLAGITGANGYRLKIDNVVLNNLTPSTTSQATGMGFNPTTANVTVGNITMATGNVATSLDGLPTLILGGTSNDNRITGTISNASDYLTGQVLSVQKTGAVSSWTLSGNNTFTGLLTHTGATAASQVSTLTLSGDNTAMTGGVTIAGNATAGIGGTVLNINSATAIGTGTLTFGTASSTIDNTSGFDITLTTNNAMTWNQDFRFTGSNSLNMGTGPVTMGGNRTVTVTANTLTVGGVIGETGGVRTLTKSGAGTLVLSGSNNYTGTTVASVGKLFINGDQTSASGTVSVSANATLGGTGIIGGSTTITPNGRLEFNLSTAATSHDKLELAAGKTLTFSGASVLTITSSNGASPGIYTLVTAPGGITGPIPTLSLPANWTASVSISGAHLLLNVTSTGTSGPVDHFAISSISSPQTVGTPINNITLTAQDTLGNTASNFTGTVTFGGTAGVTGTSASFAAGILTGVSITPTVAGSNLTFTVNDGASPTNHLGSTTFTVQSLYEVWANSNGATGGTTGNPDGDGLTNLQEFAFGTNPMTSSGNSIAYVAGGSVTTPGLPVAINFAVGGGTLDYRAVFGRRKDYQNAGLTYNIQFSADMTTWVSSSVTPTILTGPGSSGPMEAVSVPFPVDGWIKKPTFFRVGVSGN